MTQQADDDFYLDIAQAVEEVVAMGVPMTTRRMRRLADEHILPFVRRPEFGRARRIERKELRAAYKRGQLAAVRRVREREDGAARRR